MTAFPLPPFPRKGVRKRTPLGQVTTHPPSPAPRAGEGGCPMISRASARGPAEG